MIKWLRNLLLSNDDHDPDFARTVRDILRIALFAILIIIISLLIYGGQALTVYLLSGSLALILVSLVLAYRQIYWPGKLLIPLTLMIIITFIAVRANGSHDSSMAGFVAVLTVASLLMGQPAIPLVTFLSLVCIGIVIYADMAGINTSPLSSRTGIDDLATFTMILLIVSVSLNSMLGRFRHIILKSQKNEQAQASANKELRELQISLEDRIANRTAELAQRTKELEVTSRKAERRARQLQAVAVVSRAITAVQDISLLLSKATEVISKEFDFYHVGIFLIDADRAFAVLRATNSPGGKKMLQRGHQLRIGETGIVGYVANFEIPRIALDTGEDAVFFENPDLPETRSEMALPLISGDELIGVLDVQSKEPDAFSPEDIELLSILAEQVSITYQNAHQFQLAQQALVNAEASYRQYVGQEWRALVREEKRWGYRYSRAGVGPLKAPMLSAEMHKALTTGQTSVEAEKNRSQLIVPIKLRGQVIGMLNIKTEDQRAWEQDEIEIVEAVADRVALSVENARLVDASQAQASRERTISEISTRIGGSINMRNVLQTAAEELGRILPGSDVIIQLGNESKQ